MGGYMDRLDQINLNNKTYYTSPIIVETANETMPADGFTFAQKAGYRLLTAHAFNKGTKGITRINNQGNDLYSLIMPDYKKNETVTIEYFWTKG